MVLQYSMIAVCGEMYVMRQLQFFIVEYMIATVAEFFHSLHDNQNGKYEKGNNIRLGYCFSRQRQ